MGSESKDKNGDGGGGATQGIPAATKKLIQSLKEIVNCTDLTEQELYALLRECDMDPNRAVERLLAQDSFQEVKSKRERRKEKEALDSRSRGSNAGLSRGGKTGSEQNAVQSGPPYMSYKELGKSTDKEAMGSVCAAVSSSSTHYTVNPINSDSLSIYNGRQLPGTGENISASAQVSPAVQPSWVGVSKGCLSMADIVRMGTPQKSLQLSNETSHSSQDSDWNCNSKVSGISAHAESESSSSLHSQNPSGQQVFHDEWPLIEEPKDCNVSHSLNTFASSNNGNMQSNHSNVCGATISLLENCESDAGQVSQGDVVSDSHNSDNMVSASKYSRHVVTSNNGLASYSNYNLNNTGSSVDQQGSGSLQSSCSYHSGTLTSDAIVNVSSAVSDFQQLSLRNSKLEEAPTKDNHAVVLPNHLEALVADCSHLSFGTYNHDINSASSAMLASNLSRSDLDKTTAITDGSFAPYLGSRNSVHHGDKQGWFGNSRETADKNYDFLTFPQQEPVKHIVSEGTLGCGYTAMSSFLDPSLQNSQWANSQLPFKRPDFQGGTSSRDMIMKPGAFALPQRSALAPRDLSPYLEQIADMRGYRSLPQNHPSRTFINSQQAFPSNTAYNQSLPDIPHHLPQNRSNTFMSRLPSARGSFGYGNLRSSSYNPGSFSHNQSLGSLMPSGNFDEIISSQYDRIRNFGPIQQQRSLSPWDYGAESRSLPRTDFRQQSNQALSRYINSGFSEPYHSLSGLVAQQKRLNGSSDLTSKKSHEI